MVKRVTNDEIQSLPDLLTTESFALVFGAIPGEAENRRLTLQCTKVTIPEKKVNEVTTKIAGFHKNQAGLQEHGGTFTASFIETRDLLVYSRMKTWLEFCNALRTGVSSGYSSDYSVNAELYLFDSTGKQILTGKYFKTFPTSLSAIDLDSSGNSIQSPNVTFSYAYYIDSAGQTF